MRLNEPGGSFPIRSRVSIPIASSARRLRLGVIDDAAAERPRVRDDDADLHRARLPPTREQQADERARGEQLRVGRDAATVPAAAAVEELLPARP